MKKCHLPHENWKMNAEDLLSWSSTIREGVKVFEQNRAEIAKEKCNQRHQRRLLEPNFTTHVMRVVESVVPTLDYTVIEEHITKLSHNRNVILDSTDCQRGVCFELFDIFETNCWVTPDCSVHKTG